MSIAKHTVISLYCLEVIAVKYAIASANDLQQVDLRSQVNVLLSQL